MTKWLNDLPKPVKIVLTILMIILVAVIAFAIYKAVKKVIDKAKAEKLLKDQQGASVTTGSGLQVNLASVASEIYDSFFNNDIFGFSEDEDRALAAVKRVDKPNIKKLEEIYLNLYSKNLRNNLVAYLSESNWNSIKYLFD